MIFECTIYVHLDDLEPWMRESIARNYGEVEDVAFVAVIGKEGPDWGWEWDGSPFATRYPSYATIRDDDVHPKWSLWVFFQ